MQGRVQGMGELWVLGTVPGSVLGVDEGWVLREGRVQVVEQRLPLQQGRSLA